jgi:hypothetical protein
MLCAPSACSLTNLPASFAVARSLPFPNWLIGKFWQNLQWREQPVKKTVPDPLVPEIGGSSPR